MTSDRIRAIQRAVKVVVAFGVDPVGSVPLGPSDQVVLAAHAAQTLLNMARTVEQTTPKTTLAELIAKEIEEAVLEERAQILRLVGPGCVTKGCEHVACRTRKVIAREIVERSDKNS